MEKKKEGREESQSDKFLILLLAPSLLAACWRYYDNK